MPSPNKSSRQGRGGAVPEELLARLWKERAARAGLLRAAGGRRFRVLYPGRRATSAGPDFCDALMHEEGGGLVRGDVEIHVRQSDWRAHGHHRDPRYNSVALHVVYTAQAPFTRLPNGAQAPVVSMEPLLEQPASEAPGSYLWRLLEGYGYPRPRGVEELGRLLDRAGDARYQEKSRAFVALMAEEAPEETLYTAIMEGLGYSQNRAPFVELALRLPYRVLRAAALAQPPSGRASLLAWTLRLEAGFGPPARPLPAEMPPWRRRPMEAARWHLSRVRPENHPARRIEAASCLLARHLEEGLVGGLLGLVRGRPGRLEQGLTVKGRESGGPALIGRGRARDLAVNGVLPFAHALAQLRGEPTLAEAATSLYHRYPKLQENEVTREMRGQLLPPGQGHVVANARRQQGLIHLQRLLAGATPRGPH